MAEIPKKPPVNIVILGASFAGLSVAHHFLDTTLQTLGTTSSKTTYRLVIISPSSHIYWNIAAPRALVGPGLLSDDDIFHAIEPGFQRHVKAGKQVVFVQGLVVGWDIDAKNVRVSVIGGKAQKRVSVLIDGQNDDGGKRQSQVKGDGNGNGMYTIGYHALIVATGASENSKLLSLHGPHTETMGALKENWKRVGEAASIVVAGGGPSGVEIAGQLATYLNNPSSAHLPSFGSSSKNKRNSQNLSSTSTGGLPKRITLIMGTPRALPGLPEHIGRKAEKQLHGLGVHIIRNVRVTDVIEDFADQAKTKVMMDNGENIFTDVYIPATGVSPNTSFAPKEILDERGYILTGESTLDLGKEAIDNDDHIIYDNPQTLRVRRAGERVYALGDCAAYSLNYVLDVYVAVAPLMANLQKDLWAWELREANPYGGAEEEISNKEDALLKRPLKIESQLCPITRRGGVGILFNKTLPSLMVYLAKGRDYMVGKAEKVVTNGDNPY